MEKFVKLIWEAIQKFFLQKQFVFRYDYYDGTEKSLEIYETNVVQYEFVNQGTTVCIINGMELMPSQPFTPGITEIPPQRWQSAINYNEKDVTVYKYKFTPSVYCLKTCTASPRLNDWFVPNICVSTITVLIDGSPLFILLAIAPNETAINIQLLVDAGILLPGFTVAVTQEGNDLVFTVSQTLNCADPSPILAEIGYFSICDQTPVVPENANFTCVAIGQINKLLVISKEFATVRKTNP